MSNDATRHFDVVILGCGPAGERAAITAARSGKDVAVIEKAHVVGGSRVNWGTIPSKTLRESALFVHSLTRNRLHGIRSQPPGDITVGDFMHRERVVVQRELELINNALDRNRVEVVRGHGRFVGPHVVAIDGHPEIDRVSGDVLVIATGTTPNHPKDVPFDEDCVFDSDTILKLPRMPSEMVILGAGVIGIEYACIFAALGLKVTLVDTRKRLLPWLDKEILDILEKEMTRLGVSILHDDRYGTIKTHTGGTARVSCTLTSGREIEADVLLYCVGRDGNTTQLGLDSIDLRANSYGLLEVNEHYQTLQPHIYAVGDVIGFPALASTSMEQGRRAMRHAFNLSGPLGKTDFLPFAIYSIPELSYIGPTEELLQEQKIDYVVGRGQYGMNPRGQIVGDTHGVLKILCERSSMRLLAVHIVGQLASELVHIGQAFLRLEATAQDIAETLYNYPTLSDLYRHAAIEALAHRNRDPSLSRAVAPGKRQT